MEFSEWLQRALDKRQWGPSDLAQRSGVTPGQISRVANGLRGAGPDLCLAIAKGLGLSPLTVFQARGWLPYELEEFDFKLSPETALAAHEIDQLPPTIRRAVLKAALATADALREELDA